MTRQALRTSSGPTPKSRFSPIAGARAWRSCTRGIDAQRQALALQREGGARPFRPRTRCLVLVDWRTRRLVPWQIATFYLERAISGRAPALFGGAQGEANGGFIAHWVRPGPCCGQDHAVSFHRHLAADLEPHRRPISARVGEAFRTASWSDTRPAREEAASTLSRQRRCARCRMTLAEYPYLRR